MTGLFDYLIANYYSTSTLWRLFTRRFWRKPGAIKHSLLPPEGRRVFITKIVLSGTFSVCFLQICHEIDVTRWKKMNTLCETAFRHRCRPLSVLIRSPTPFRFHLRGKIFKQHKSHVFNGTAAKPPQREEPKALSFYGAACFKKSALSWGDDRELSTS